MVLLSTDPPICKYIVEDHRDRRAQHYDIVSKTEVDFFFQIENKPPGLATDVKSTILQYKIMFCGYSRR